jgi:hypothetical protein
MFWILERTEDYEIWCDCVSSTVIRAGSEEEARRVASESAGNEGPGVWLDPKRSSCCRIEEDGPAEVILEDCPPG